VVVRDFNVVGIFRLPTEADAKLIVKPNTVLASPVAGESFQAVSWRNSEFANVSDPIDLIELATGHRP
jgi:hypothetical protein